MNDVIPLHVQTDREARERSWWRYFCGNEGLMTCPKERGRADGIKFLWGWLALIGFLPTTDGHTNVGLMKVG